MSIRVDAGKLQAGAITVGDRGLGVLGSVIRATTATGSNGPGILYNDWDSAADDSKDFRALIVTPPSSGVFVAYEDGSFSLTGAANGSYSLSYRLFVDGADLGLATASFVVSSGGDTTPPTLTGSITVSSVTQTGYTLAWPAGSDNIGVIGYELSLDGGGIFTQFGNVLTVNVTGRTAGATDQVRIRARDAAGLFSTPVLSGAVTLLAASDVTPPTLTGSITVSSVTQTGYTLAWPAGSDNIGVIGYELSLDGAASFAQIGAVTTISVTSRTAGATDAVRVRSRDAAGLVSVPLSVSVTLLAPPPARATTIGIRSDGTLAGIFAIGQNRRIAIISAGQIIALVGSPVCVGIGADGRLIALI